MRRHLTILAVLHLLHGLFGLCIALLAFGASLFGATVVGFMPDMPGWIAGVVGVAGAFAGVFLAALSLPAIALGWGLWTRRAWARPLGLVVGVLSLVNFPIGTIIGAYTIWAMLQSETAMLLGRRADPAFR